MANAIQKHTRAQADLTLTRSNLNVQVARQNIQTAKEALAQAKENLRITNLLYMQQLINSTEVLDARAYLTQANSNYYHAYYGYMIALSELERAVGRHLF